LPKIYLEHDPPRQHATDELHPADDPNMLIVHVTAFNALMWRHERSPTRIIEHGVVAPDGVAYRGELPRGIVVVNHLARRGRRLGHDLFLAARAAVPLDLIGMGAEEAGGIGEIKHEELPSFTARYRFFFNPIRYTSLGLAVVEAMMIGLPIVGLATTELVTVVRNGEMGFVDTSLERLVPRMRELVANPSEARRLGAAARKYARERFGIGRFVSDWNAALTAAVS
jgi:glycosyltransferase involved in cell wall biosynthesis